VGRSYRVASTLKRVRAADIRRGAQGRGCNTIGSPGGNIKARRVDPTVTHGSSREIPGRPDDCPSSDGLGAPKGEPNVCRESAAGITVRASGKAIEALLGRKAEKRIG